MNELLHQVGSRLLRALSFGEIVSKPIAGSNHKLYFEPSQHLTFFFQRKIEYEKNIQDKIKKYIQPGDTVFDIGGNIGQYALFFSDLVGDTGQVYSFEPDFKNYAFLNFNKNINLCTNLYCINCGIGETDSTLELYRDSRTGGRMSSFIKSHTGKNYEGLKAKVQVKTFDSIIGQYGKPDFVKIDVEAWEQYVLKGLTADIDSKIMMEVRDDTKAAIFTYFVNKRFKCFWLEKGETEVKDVNQLHGICDVLFIK